MMMMNNFLRKVGRFNVVGVKIHYNKLERCSYTTNPVPSSSKEASGAVLDDLSKAEACGSFDRDTIANAAAKAGPAVVHLDVDRHLHRLDTSWDMWAKAKGSGTIIDKDGTILTCAHVVAGSPRDQIQATLQDGRAFEGKVVYADMQSYTIAIVKINSKSPLPEAKLGSSSRLRTGDWVMAMGAPHSLQNSVSAGIVSCVNSKIAATGTPREYIQTDCACTEGNFGGPLVNMDGEVVGVVVMGMKVDRFSFSAPVDSGKSY